MSSVLNLWHYAVNAEQPAVTAPWPDLMDVPKWLWNHAAPEIWKEHYPADPDLSTFLIDPGVWGVTDQMYTSVISSTALQSGWTMGDGGRFQLTTVPQASDGYLYWQANMYPLQMARDLLDRPSVRLDALQSPDEDLTRLSVWANIDPTVVVGFPLGLLRRYIRYSRALERHRGSERMQEPLGAILGATVEISWDEDEPFKRVVAVYGQTGAHTKKLIRRNFPPHINIEMQTIIGFAGYTGSFYTAKVPSGVPQDSDGYTASQVITTEAI